MSRSGGRPDPQRRHPAEGGLVVDVLAHDRAPAGQPAARGRRNARRGDRPDDTVEDAALPVIVARQAHRCLFAHRHVDRSVGGKVQVPLLDCRDPGVSLAAQPVELGLLGDHAHGAAKAARAVERTLRPAQHFDALHVEHQRADGRIERHVVDIEPGGVEPLDPANGDRAVGEHAVVGRAETQVRDRRGKALDIGGAPGGKLLAADRGDAQPDVLERLRPSRGRDHDRVHVIVRFRARGLLRAAILVLRACRGRRRQHCHQHGAAHHEYMRGRSGTVPVGARYCDHLAHPIRICLKQSGPSPLAQSSCAESSKDG